MLLVKLDIKNRNRAIFKTQKRIADLKLLCDEFKLDNAKTEAAIV